MILQLFFLVILLFLHTRWNVVAGDDSAAAAYAHDPTEAVMYVDWMSQVPGYWQLSRLSIPGTHDSGASQNGGDLVFTQSLSLREQLLAGIRVLDIRLGIDTVLSSAFGSCSPNEVRLCLFHGLFHQNQSWEDVLSTCQTFLQENPTETILIRVKLENGYIEDFAKAVEDGMNQFDSNLFYSGTDFDPTLDMVRGQIVLLYDYVPSETTPTLRGIPYSSLNIQDQYQVANNLELALKWGHVKNQLTSADTTSSSFTTTIFMNYLSASSSSSEVYPYFIASGNSGPNDNDSALLTGFVDGCYNQTSCSGGVDLCLAEYPRVNCDSLSGCCSVAYVGMNDLTRNFIRDQVSSLVGMVMMDFPGPGLIEAILHLSAPNATATYSTTTTTTTSSPTYSTTTTTTPPSKSLSSTNATTTTLTTQKSKSEIHGIPSSQGLRLDISIPMLLDSIFIVVTADLGVWW